MSYADPDDWLPPDPPDGKLAATIVIAFAIAFLLCKAAGLL